MTAAKEVTIVHVPRERYGATQRSLESILEHTQGVPYKLLILDAGSPPAIAEYLRKTAETVEDAALLRFDFVMSPNELRNEAIRRLDTPYVAFVDNDAVVTSEWLDPLLETAKEHGAWVVGPTILIGEPEDGVIHVAGAECHVFEENGKRLFSYLQQSHRDELLPAVADELEARPCTCAEFHCVLVSKQAFDHIGLLDEGIMSFCECDSFSMDVMAAGGLIYFQPRSVATYLTPRERLDGEELAYFLLRWSDEWNERSIDTFMKKYRLSDNERWIQHARQWPKQHRRYALAHLAPPLGRIFELIHYKLSRPLGERLASALENRLMRDTRSRRAAGLALRDTGS